MRYEVLFVLTHHYTYTTTSQGLYLDPPEGRKRQTVYVNTGAIIVMTEAALF